MVEEEDRPEQYDIQKGSICGRSAMDGNIFYRSFREQYVRFVCSEVRTFNLRHSSLSLLRLCGFCSGNECIECMNVEDVYFVAVSKL